MKDIAGEAGFSVPTVSAVLGGRADKLGIKAETRRRIREAAKHLNYRPNLAARGLRTNRTYTIGLMLHSPRELIYAEMLSAIQARLLAHGYAGICAFWNDMDEARTAFRAVLDRGVDGLISCHDDLTLLPENLPTVLFQQRHPRCDSIVRDGEESMRRAVDYLVDLGHRRIGTIFLDRKRFEERIRRSLLARGIAHPPFWTAGRHKDHAAAIQDCLAAFFALPGTERPTALICRNDTTAMTVISLLGAQGLAVPDDVSVLGSDGVSLGAWTNPPLTTFGVPPSALAKRLVDLLLRRIKQPDAPFSELLLRQPLIERRSCAPPKAATSNEDADRRAPVKRAAHTRTTRRSSLQS